ncbi:hypothetical protein [Streptomyces sp. NPDC041003]|uniref:hypothetical protein n=1 Tax=Streptomyces sp. NPDC041003 TaxID=3155730 RepID=UPI0033E66650
MTTPHDATRIKDDYAQQIANDLTANHTAQQHTRTELHRLQQELQHLEENAKILLKMQEALGIASRPTATPAAKPRTNRTAVPAARSATPTPKKTPQPKTTPTVAAATTPTADAATPTAATAPIAAGSGAPSGAADAEVKAPRATKSTGKSETKKAAKKETNRPSWLDLVTAAITSQNEPKSAAEVTNSITTAHPDRKVQPAVIRNTLEQGVARGLLERSKQGRSVYYTPTTSTPNQPQPQQAPVQD